MKKLKLLKITRLTFGILSLWFFIDIAWRGVLGYGPISRVVYIIFSPILGSYTDPIMGIILSLFWLWVFIAYLADQAIRKINPNDTKQFTSFTLWKK